MQCAPQDTVASAHPTLLSIRCLFSQAGMSLPEQRRPKGFELFPSRPIPQQGEGPILLLFVTRLDRDSIKIPFPAPFQLIFSFMKSESSSVVSLAPRACHAYLDYGVYDSFRDTRAAKAALRLQGNGIWLIGQLVQLSESEVCSVPGVDDAALQAMKQRLATINLGFDTRVPTWNRRRRAVNGLQS
jgi:hypothetical protein